MFYFFCFLFFLASFLGGAFEIFRTGRNLHKWHITTGAYSRLDVHWHVFPVLLTIFSLVIAVWMVESWARSSLDEHAIRPELLTAIDYLLALFLIMFMLTVIVGIWTVHRGKPPKYVPHRWLAASIGIITLGQVAAGVYVTLEALHWTSW